MLKFYFNPKYKYTNRSIIDVTDDTNFVEKNYVNIDSPDTINGHIIYKFDINEEVVIPSYIVDTVSNRRWFVSGITQLNSSKFQISLLRDMISENPVQWKSEEAYIEAGTATNYNKYKIWNLPYTNTKINQQRLNINGKSSFFVFYANEQHISSGQITEDDLELEYATIPGLTGYDVKVEELNDIPNFDFVGAGNITSWENGSKSSLIIQPVSGNTGYPYQKWTCTNAVLECQNGYDPGIDIGYTEYWNTGYFNFNRFDNYTNNNAKGQVATAMSYCCTSYMSDTSVFSQIAQVSEIAALDAYVGKVIFDEDTNKYYRIDKTRRLQYHNDLLSNSRTNVSLFISTLRNIQFPGDSGTSYIDITANNNAFRFQSIETISSYTLVELGTAQSFALNLKADVRKLPKSAVRCVNIVSDGTIADQDIAQCLMLAQTNPGNVSSTGRIIDIQYLPFSIATAINTNIKINGNDMIAEFIDNDDFIYNIDLPDLTGIHKETDTIKIVSPSRASQYLFRPYNNDGNMEFGVKITLKPYASTIYIRPSTKGLLMYDWDDKDCLIINEDFSLTNVTSEWTNYVYSNKNYSNIFEREIQGREFERGWERKVEQAQKAMDKITARNIEGQQVKNQLWNLPIISSIGAGLASSTGMNQDYLNAAATDRAYNEALYQEGISISRDMFNYQLDNVKSQPLLPSKITTIDCKLLDGVYLEYYSTNPTELAAIDNFYKYNGHRIDDFGTFSQYYGHFIKGRIIISQFYSQPEIEEINRRLEMGIFTEVNYGN